MTTKLDKFPITPALKSLVTDLDVMLINNQPYFVAKQLADILEYASPDKMYKHIEANARIDVKSMTAKTAGMGCKSLNTFVKGLNYQTIFITEAGMYAAIFGSKKPEAKVFVQWVCNDVLPSIRKTGTYSVDPQVAFINSIGAMTPEQLDNIITNSTALKDDTRDRLLEVLLKTYTVSSMTKLLSEHGVTIPTSAVFIMLEDMGMLSGSHTYAITKYGLPAQSKKMVRTILGVGLQYGRNAYGRQPQWIDNKFDSLLQLLGKQWVTYTDDERKEFMKMH